jgi:hypothetical protein
VQERGLVHCPLGDSWKPAKQRRALADPSRALGGLCRRLLACPSPPSQDWSSLWNRPSNCSPTAPGDYRANARRRPLPRRAGRAGAEPAGVRARIGGAGRPLTTFEGRARCGGPSPSLEASWPGAYSPAWPNASRPHADDRVSGGGGIPQRLDDHHSDRRGSHLPYKQEVMAAPSSHG